MIFLNRIVNKVVELQIPQSLVLNLDQINLKYVYTDKTTTSKKGLTSVTIGGLRIKKHYRNPHHHLKWNISTNGTYLWGKTVQSLPKFDFPEDFFLSAFNYSNIAESIKLIKEITFRWISVFTYFTLVHA